MFSFLSPFIHTWPMIRLRCWIPLVSYGTRSRTVGKKTFNRSKSSVSNGEIAKFPKHIMTKPCTIGSSNNANIIASLRKAKSVPRQKSNLTYWKILVFWRTCQVYDTFQVHFFLNNNCYYSYFIIQWVLLNILKTTTNKIMYISNIHKKEACQK